MLKAYSEQIYLFILAARMVLSADWYCVAGKEKHQPDLSYQNTREHISSDYVVQS